MSIEKPSGNSSPDLNQPQHLANVQLVEVQAEAPVVRKKKITKSQSKHRDRSVSHVSHSAELKRLPHEDLTSSSLQNKNIQPVSQAYLKVVDQYRKLMHLFEQKYGKNPDARKVNCCEILIDVFFKFNVTLMQLGISFMRLKKESFSMYVEGILDYRIDIFDIKNISIEELVCNNHLLNKIRTSHEDIAPLKALYNQIHVWLIYVGKQLDEIERNQNVEEEVKAEVNIGLTNEEATLLMQLQHSDETNYTSKKITRPVKKAAKHNKPNMGCNWQLFNNKLVHFMANINFRLFSCKKLTILEVVGRLFFCSPPTISCLIDELRNLSYQFPQLQKLLKHKIIILGKKCRILDLLSTDYLLNIKKAVVVLLTDKRKGNQVQGEVHEQIEMLVEDLNVWLSELVEYKPVTDEFTPLELELIKECEKEKLVKQKKSNKKTKGQKVGETVKVVLEKVDVTFDLPVVIGAEAINQAANIIDDNIEPPTKACPDTEHYLRKILQQLEVVNDDDLELYLSDDEANIMRGSTPTLSEQDYIRLEHIALMSLFKREIITLRGPIVELKCKLNQSLEQKPKLGVLIILDATANHGLMGQLLSALESIIKTKITSPLVDEAQKLLDNRILNIPDIGKCVEENYRLKLMSIPENEIQAFILEYIEWLALFEGYIRDKITPFFTHQDYELENTIFIPD